MMEHLVYPIWKERADLDAAVRAGRGEIRWYVVLDWIFGMCCAASKPRRVGAPFLPACWLLVSIGVAGSAYAGNELSHFPAIGTGLPTILKMTYHLASASEPQIDASTTVQSTAEDAFFGNLKDDTPKARRPMEANRDESDLRVTLQMTYRLHYAPHPQTNDYPFTRQSPAVVSTRVGPRLVVDYRLNGSTLLRFGARASYDASLPTSRSEVQVDEVFLDSKFDAHWRGKFGQQFVALGQSNYFQVLDVLSPTDDREIGLAELNESRLPILASRLTYANDRDGFDLVWKHIHRPNRLAYSGSDFDPFISIGGRDSVDFEGTGAADNKDVVLRYFGSRPWGDLSLLAGRVSSTSPYLVGAQAQNGRPIFSYPRSNVYGMSANYVQGGWVLKTEYAYHSALPNALKNVDQLIANGAEVSVSKPLSEWLLGAQYSSLSNWTIDTEFLIQRILDYDNSIADPRQKIMGVVNIEKKALHDALRISLLWGRWWQGDGNLFRLRMEYDFTDRVSMSAGYITYGAKPEGLLYPYRYSDRLFFTLVHSL